MIYSNKFKYIYISIPKTGSTSISNILISDFDGALYKDRHDNEIIFEDYFIFTTIRNPYGRAISGYKYLKYKLNNLNIDNCWEYFHMISMNEYLNNLFVFDNFATVNSLIKTHKRNPQSIIINNYLRFENLEDDFNKLYFVKDKIYLKKENKSKIYLNKSLIDKICNKVKIKYKKDFELFNYENINTYREFPIFY